MIMWLDCETTGLNPFKDRIRCIVWKLDDGKICTPHGVYNFENNDLQAHSDFIKDYVSSDTIGGHNISFDIKFIKQQLSISPGDCIKYIDTKIIYHYEDPHQSCKLKDLGQRILKQEVIRLADLQNCGKAKNKKKISFDQIPMEDLIEYCKQDVDLSHSLYYRWLPKIRVEKRIKCIIDYA